MTVRKWGLESLVNTVFADDQSDPSIAALADGGYVIAWEDFSGGDDPIVRAQRYTAAGQTVGMEVNLGGGTSGPSITALSSGGFSIGVELKVSAGNTDPYVRTYNANGALINSTTLVREIDIADDIALGRNGGGFIAVWHDSDRHGGDIVARRASPDGSQNGSIFIVNATVAGDQSRPDVAELTNGRIAFAWADGHNIRTRTFDAAGGAPTAEVQVNAISGSGADNCDPHVTALANGGYVVTYTLAATAFPDSDLGVRARIFDPSGNAYSGEIILGSTLAGDQLSPEIVTLNTGGFAALWADASRGALTIRGQVFDVLGARSGGEFTVNTESFASSSDPVQISAAALSDGRITVTWEGVYDSGLDKQGHSIHSQTIDSRDGIGTGSERGETLYGSNISSSDEIYALGGSDALYGMSGDDYLSGGDGNDRLDGGAGADIMIGGGNNDTYYVDNAGDRAIEGVGQGTSDWVATKIDYTLEPGMEIEALSTTSVNGGTEISLIGNEFDQTITGNGARNIIDGKGGADIMSGLRGGDAYYVDNVADKIVEKPNPDGNDDLALTSVSYALGPGVEVEFLSTRSSDATNLMGNEFTQNIVGNDASNIISGKAGNDHITGRGGSDVFVFDTTLNSSTNVDAIQDFDPLKDVIWLENKIFTQIIGTWTLTADQFAENITGLAMDADDRIIYETDTGNLFYDADGNGAGDSIQFAKLGANLGLTNADFVVI